MRIAHFSDFHLCPELNVQWQIASIMELIEDARKRGTDQFVFTGDFVDYANLNDLSRLYREFRAAGLNHRNTSVIPGNHDIFPVPGCSLTRFEQILRTTAALKKTAQGNYESFVRRSSFLLRGTTPLWSNLRFPYFRKLSREVLLVGVDTTNSKRTGRLEFSRGSFDEEDSEKILKELERVRYAHCKWRILAIHHHPWREKTLRGCDFRDVQAVRDFIIGGTFDAVLCGHVHRFNTTAIGGASVVCSACHFDRDEDHCCIGYHLITLGRTMHVKTIGCQ